MSRVINTQSPTKIRNQLRRSIAEMLRRLSQKPEVDQDAKDMTAMIVFMLTELQSGVESSVAAWEKRGYWMKAERFLRDWEWTAESAANIEDVIRNEAWDLLPELLADLFPRFADVKIKTMTRKASLWQGAHEKLLAQPPTKLPF